MWDLNFRFIEGQRIRLEPPSEHLVDGLCDALLGEENGWFATWWQVNSREKIAELIKISLSGYRNGRSLSFVVRDLISGKVAGISHFSNINERHRQLEIGGTQVGPAFRRSHINTEMKYLMLKDAFERLGTIRVYFKVSSKNYVSQNAVARLGIQYEGCLRDDCLYPDGRIGDYFIYGVTKKEWPTLKQRLELMTHRHNFSR